jgi:hypothetical protein
VSGVESGTELPALVRRYLERVAPPLFHTCSIPIGRKSAISSTEAPGLMQLYDPSAHEQLTDERWGDSGRRRTRSSPTVAAFDPRELWHANEWDLLGAASSPTATSKHRRLQKKLN